MLEIAILIPCFNEEKTVGEVVRQFQKSMPDCVVYVYDNNSVDRTIEVATSAGAIVRREKFQGKGNVIRRMFADIEANIYVVTDGDLTYDTESAPVMVELLLNENLDMVVGTRIKSQKADIFPRGHYWGNILLSGFTAFLFGKRLTDMLSGYRVLSRRLVKSFPALTKGFEIETELTIHALELDMPIAEVETPYRARPKESRSKLRTYRDGSLILKTILLLYKEVHPLKFFFIWFMLFTSFSIGLAYPIFVTFIETGLVPRFPTAIAATGCMILGFLSLTCGFILDSVSRGRREIKRLKYLSIPLAQSSRDDE